MTTKKRVRSPNYPSINLENAITRARELYEAEHTHPATADVASRHWGYKSAAAGGRVDSRCSTLIWPSRYGWIEE